MNPFLFSGIVLFLIFGRNHTAALCLPCCYYSPPEEAYRPPSFSVPSTETLEIVLDYDNNNNNNSENNCSQLGIEIVTPSIDESILESLEEAFVRAREKY